MCGCVIYMYSVVCVGLTCECVHMCKCVCVVLVCTRMWMHVLLVYGLLCACVKMRAWVCNCVYLRMYEYVCVPGRYALYIPYTMICHM